MIEVAVSGKETLHFGRPADGGKHSLYCFDIGFPGMSGLSQSSTTAKELRLGNAREVTIGEDVLIADFVVDIGDGHPGDVDMRGSGSKGDDGGKEQDEKESHPMIVSLLSVDEVVHLKFTGFIDDRIPRRRLEQAEIRLASLDFPQLISDVATQ